MEAGIQFLTVQKIRELLALCEISDHSHEPVKQQILDISNFGTYRDASENGCRVRITF